MVWVSTAEVTVPEVGKREPSLSAGDYVPAAPHGRLFTTSSSLGSATNFKNLNSKLLTEYCLLSTKFFQGVSSPLLSLVPTISSIKERYHYNGPIQSRSLRVLESLCSFLLSIHLPGIFFRRRTAVCTGRRCQLLQELCILLELCSTSAESRDCCQSSALKHVTPWPSRSTVIKRRSSKSFCHLFSETQTSVMQYISYRDFHML